MASFDERFHDTVRIESLGIEIEQEVPAIDESKTDPLSTGCTVWEGGLRLVHFLSEDEQFRNENVVDRSIVELGCGTGLCGLACAALGARRVVLTDLADRIDLARRNAARNGWISSLNSCSVTVAELRWGSPMYVLHGILDESNHRTTVLCSEVIYHQNQVAPLAHTVSSCMLMSSGDSRAILANRKTHEPVAYSALLRELRLALSASSRKYEETVYYTSPDFDIVVFSLLA